MRTVFNRCALKHFEEQVKYLSTSALTISSHQIFDHLKIHVNLFSFLRTRGEGGLLRNVVFSVLYVIYRRNTGIPLVSVIKIFDLNRQSYNLHSIVN